MCSGKDQIPVLAENWGHAPLWITKAEIVFRPDGKVAPGSYVYAGDSTPGADILAYGVAGQAGAFTVAEAAPQGTAMLLGPTDHVDLHVGCYPVGVHYQVLEIVWYLKAPSVLSAR